MPNDVINANQTFHNPIEEKLKVSLLHELVSKVNDVKVYFDQKILVSTIIPTYNLNKIAIVCGNAPSEHVFKINPNLTCQFTMNNDIYFFNAKSSFTDKSIVFTQPQTIYKIQRRENFRVHIPHHIIQQIEIVGQRHLKTSMTDLSLGGCQLNIKYPEATQITSQFKMDTQISLKIKILDLNNHTLHCRVKFIKDNPETHSMLCGVAFEKLTSDETQDLQSIIFKIDRINRQANLD